MLVQRPQGSQPAWIIGSKHDDGDAISSGMVEHGCTNFFRVCGWQLLVVRISRVQGSRGPSRRLARRGTRGGRRRNRGIGKQIGATQVRRLPKRDIDGFAIGESKGSQKVQTTTGVSGSFSPNYPSPDVWEAGLDQRLTGLQVARHAVRSERVRGVEADAIVPEGDASETFLSRKG